MKKQILNLGKALNKVDQKAINGGYIEGPCRAGTDMDKNCLCTNGGQCSSGTCKKGMGQIYGNCA
ncbi:hypothetical protein C8N26_2551 [Tenacibaculum lutimaris]|uniref:Uncharacterized protein n=1 Tax=Tenacibaculum lutimaris TaxID=285258 RepID=A0A420DYJ4_9FLAO|nr:hypothetical protein [Tenacibaculum lutimaris]RKF02904.1 hypothetical protein C8N26_2551 [Tenacibaculum lutimaris]